MFLFFINYKIILNGTRQQSGSFSLEENIMDKGIIVIKPGTALILKTNLLVSKEDMRKARGWFKKHMDLDVKIIGGDFDIVGIEDGKGMGKEFL